MAKTIADVIELLQKMDQTTKVLEIAIGYEPDEPDVIRSDGVVIGRRRKKITFVIESAPGQILSRGLGVRP